VKIIKFLLLNITLKIKIILENPVKFLIVRNLHYKDGYIDIKLLKILQEEPKICILQNYKPQVKSALELLKNNEQFTMNELVIDIKKKYPTFDITP